MANCLELIFSCFRIDLMPRIGHVFQTQEWEILTFADIRKIFAWSLTKSMDTKHQRTSESLEDKMLQNEELMMSEKIYGEHKEDPNNLCTVHPRFWQAMPTQSGAEIYKKRAELNFLIPPTANWDLTDLGNVQLDPQTWVEVANLGSQNISINMLIKNNKTPKKMNNGKTGSQAANFLAAREAFNCIDEIQSALILLMIVRRRYFPGDESVSCLIYFLTSHNWFYRLSRRLNRGTYSASLHLALLQNFIDETIQQNGINFRKNLPYESFGKLIIRLQNTICVDNLTHLYAQAEANARQCSSRRPEPNNNNPKTNSKVNHVPKSSKQFGESLCRWYNASTCQRNKANNRCITSAGVVLLHQCSFQFPSGRFCGKLHPKIEHGNKSN